MTRHSISDSTKGLVGLGIALGGAAFGAFILSRQREGRSSDDAPGYTARRGFGDYAVTGRTVTIRKPREELFAFWRDFGNLARFMENLEKVEQGAGGRSTWHIKAPAGQTVAVETEIVREQDGELIAWRSVEGSDIDTEGRVTFEDAPGERGTRVGLIIAYKPPAGALGQAAAKLFQREPETQARHDLKRLKMLMETGEIATSARRRENTRAAQQENA
ncbi:cyclase [Erythrobacter arachoides]|uniref:Cyclase n=1 Tax=Aurantiacibacter arachoides TaxID=1850444 RepID=A0A844ZYB5_9SPHN|nr:SRPBCC family protein [Aurantiacibacter arachoides]MXO92708.1 cyclase [Aurantiacibacter arachoides]GGD55083.1 cyclase [Aurantiacibacter arachoides]